MSASSVAERNAHSAALQTLSSDLDAFTSLLATFDPTDITSVNRARQSFIELQSKITAKREAREKLGARFAEIVNPETPREERFTERTIGCDDDDFSELTLDEAKIEEVWSTLGKIVPRELFDPSYVPFTIEVIDGTNTEHITHTRGYRDDVECLAVFNRIKTELALNNSEIELIDHCIDVISQESGSEVDFDCKQLLQLAEMGDSYPTHSEEFSRCYEYLVALLNIDENEILGDDPVLLRAELERILNSLDMKMIS